MSIFFGIFRPQGGPVDLEAFEDMCKASKREGFDGIQVHVEDKIAVGYLMLRVSPEDEYDEQPLKSSCGRYLMVGHFRLDYRDELGDKIGLTQLELEKTPDSKLVMMAYQKWGEDCFSYIDGDFCCIIYDFLQNSILLIKDKLGYSSLYYIFNENSLFFSSVPITLTNTRFIQVNGNAYQFHRASIRKIGPTLGYTLIKDLFYVKSSTSLRVDSHLILTDRIYHDLNKNDRVYFHNSEDYAYELYSLFAQAVKSRLHVKDKVGIFLSSGRDSTAVAICCSKILEQYGSRMMTYTHVPNDISAIPEFKKHKADEKDRVKEFVGKTSNIDARFFGFKDILFSELMIDGRMLNLANPIININSFWIDGILRESSKDGVKRIFTGGMGNFTISWNAPNILWDYLSEFKVKKIYMYLKEISSIQKQGFAKVSWHFLIKPILYEIYFIINNFIFLLNPLSTRNSLFQNIKVSNQVSKNEKSFSYVIPEFTFFIKNNKLKRYIITRNFQQSMNRWTTMGSLHAKQIVDPTADLRVVNYCLSIKEDLFNYLGNKKYIYKLAFKDLLPDFILNSSITYLQSSDACSRFDSDYVIQRQLKEILTDEKLSGIVNKKSLMEDWEKYRNSQNFSDKMKSCNNLLIKLSLTRAYVQICNNFT